MGREPYALVPSPGMAPSTAGSQRQCPSEEATSHRAAVGVDGVAEAGITLLANEILLIPLKADFRTGRASDRLLSSWGENVVLLSQLIFPFNLFLSQDGIQDR